MADQAVVRRAMIKAKPKAVYVNGVGKYPHREVMDSSQIKTIDALGISIIRLGQMTVGYMLEEC